MQSANTMLIQFFSDLHLEFVGKWDPAWLRVTGDVLVVAGDLGDPWQEPYHHFLTDVSVRFQRVVLVLGNHECYDDGGERAAHERVQDIVSNMPNVFLLHAGSTMDYHGYRFVGATLWSHVEPGDPLCNDFIKIGGMTPDVYNALHQRDRQGLLRQLDDLTGPPLIVVTHHLPSFRLTHPSYDPHPCFASRSDDLLRPERVAAWFYGHTHRASDQVLDGVRTFCNPVGYPGENREVDLGKFLELIPI